MITSVANRDVRALRRLRNKTNRDRLGLVLVEGNTALSQVLANQGVIDRVVVTPRGDRKLSALVKQARSEGAQKIIVSEEIMAMLCDASSPPSIYAVVRAPRLTPSTGTEFFWLAVAGVKDPGEMGAILRAAAAFNAGWVVCLPGCVDAFSPKVIRASAGAAWKVAVSSSVSFESVEADATEAQMTSLTLSDGTPSARTELPSKLLLVMDAVGDSLGGEMRPDAILTQPGLSAALALPVVLSDWTRRHRA